MSPKSTGGRPIAPLPTRRSARIVNGDRKLRNPPVGHCKNTVATRHTTSTAINAGLPLPTELLLQFVAARINDHRGGREALLKDLKVLCLVSKAFQASCQHEIFRFVTLQPPIWEDYERNIHSSTHMIPRFVDVVSSNPPLGSYVRRLVLRLPTVCMWPQTNFVEMVDATKALVMMENLQDLSVEVRGGNLSSQLLDYKDRGRCMDPLRTQTTQEGAILALMRQDTLRSLTVRNMEIPSKDFSFSPNLERLSLLNSPFEVPMDWYPMFNLSEYVQERSVDIPRLSVKHLTIRGKSIGANYAKIQKLELATATRRLPLRLDSVETLEIVDDTSRVGRRVLSEVHNVKQLHLRTEAYIDSTWRSTSSPLSGLSPRCFSTLTVLSFEIGLFMVRGDPILDPYQGLFLDRTLLTSLTQLEELNINITVRAYQWDSFPDETFGDRWRALDETVAPRASQRPFAHLKRMTLFVLLSVNNVYPHLLTEFGRLFTERLLSRQFEGLRELEQAGKIDLVLGIDDWDINDNLDRNWETSRDDVW